MTGRRGRGAYTACRTLRDGYLAILRHPEDIACYCLSSWGPSRALLGALRYAKWFAAVSALPPPERGAHLARVLRCVLRAGAALGGGERYERLLMAAVEAGYPALLQALLEQLARLPKQGGAQAQDGYWPWVSAAATALREVVGRGQLEASRALLHALTETAHLPLHYSLRQGLFREAAEQGNPDVVRLLLRALKPSRSELRGMVQSAAKAVKGWVNVGVLLEAGAEVSSYAILSAASSARPQVCQAVVQAAQGQGSWEPGLPSRALSFAVYSDSAAMRKDGWADQVATLRFLALNGAVDLAGPSEASRTLITAAKHDSPRDALMEPLALFGAEVDPALVTLCAHKNSEVSLYTTPAEELLWLRRLLDLGTETEAGAAAALRVALRDGRWAQAQELLLEGTVPRAEAEAALRGAARGEGETPAAADASGGAAAAAAAVEDAGRRLECITELALGGALEGPGGGGAAPDPTAAGGAGGASSRFTASEEEAVAACARGDGAVAARLVGLGLVGEAAAAEAYRAARRGGHEAVARRLRLLGAVSALVEGGA
ncbi:hypothetical protein HYH03_002394 [Edaphochlamys debaryana]|uniref:Uncharacterized protein n=1 Tax=Edaphochlamys debaryana TaxID=47281 RepID=A0A835YD74_9CHLO|nr:hypothetical protein HYH03_002394 [Edaphochlamys debaryana]|eukprot:KAG2499447.1 hypothetical protein HYH03_002394 [Edaphochlamys debaryana]